MRVGQFIIIDRIKKHICKLHSDVSKLNRHIHGMEDVIKKYVFTDPDQVYEIIVPNGIDIIFISEIGGGGAGGYAKIDGHIYSGGGGGSGSVMIECPMSIESGSRLEIRVGRGGSIDITRDLGDSSIDGEESSVTVFKRNLKLKKASVTGGRGANGNKCGDGGKGSLSSNLNGDTGEDGQTQVFSMIHNAKGGNGGSSYFGPGGLGGMSGDNSTNAGLNGKKGSGGGGAGILDMSDKPGNGGDGIVIIHF